ncbi:MAG: SIMPL domain-containing protein [Sporichthyaceae bacterium]|nr:SIMPL domain-containing protein [Sporichthyaceae bacterium]
MKRGITVTGTGTASAAPDLLRLDVGAEAVGRTPEQALSEASQALDRIRAALQAGGVAAADLASGTMSLWPRYEDKGKLSGYAAELRMAAKLRDLGNAGELISQAVAAGGTPARLHGMSFEHSEPSGLLAQARAAAWRDAEAAATQLAELAGRRLGLVLSVVESPGVGPVLPVLRGAVSALAAESVPIEPGLAEVSVRVEVRYGIADPT